MSFWSLVKSAGKRVFLRPAVGRFGVGARRERWWLPWICLGDIDLIVCCGGCCAFLMSCSKSVVAQLLAAWGDCMPRGGACEQKPSFGNGGGYVWLRGSVTGELALLPARQPVCRPVYFLVSRHVFAGSHFGGASQQAGGLRLRSRCCK